MIDETQMTLAVDYQGEDPTGWHMTEKFNGCRAYWDGERFWTRGGNVIVAPSWFTYGLPRTRCLDGEIFAGYGNFEGARLAVQYGRFTPAMRFMVFDAPGFGAWTDRIRRIEVAGCCTCIKPVICKSYAHLHATVIAINANGGEGVILRSPTAKGYECGRSRNMLRVLPEFLHISTINTFSVDQDLESGARSTVLPRLAARWGLLLPLDL
jgi:DNA ligase 1